MALGLAVAGIVASIVAVTAAVNIAKTSIDSACQAYSAPSISSGSSGGMGLC